MRHPAEDWMRGPVEPLLPRRHDLQKRLELGDVRGEFAGPRSRQLLIDLRAGRNASRPPHGTVQREPLHQRSLQPARDVAHRHLADPHPEGVAEVADHLVRRHPSPAAGALRPHRSQPADEVHLARLTCESLHWIQPASDRIARTRAGGRRPLHEPISRSPPASRNAVSARWRPASASFSSARNAGSLRNASNCGRAESVGATK